MTVCYEYAKCKSIVFAKSIEHFRKEIKTVNSGREIYIGFREPDDQTFDETIEDCVNRLKNIRSESVESGTVTFIVDATSYLFSDIDFSTDENKLGESSANANMTQDVRQDILLGASKNLDAFSNNAFTVVAGKKNCGIQALHPNQNHDILDSIARNGVLVYPRPALSFSVGKLMDAISKFRSFNVVVIHPELIFNARCASYPCEYIEPVYEVGKGEITSLFYRLIASSFYGYMSVYDESNRERLYDL